MNRKSILNFAAAFACLIIPMSISTIANAQSGIASVYSGGKTANGEVARAHGLTAAHRTLPFGTMVRVHLAAAARAIGFSGLAPVTLSVVGG